MDTKLVKDSAINDFTVRLASKAPTPGGGGTAALVAALGASLGSMVAELTIGKKKYADVEAEIKNERDKAEALRVRLLALADADAAVFFPLSQAYSLPADTAEQKQHKDAVMADALKAACEVPIEIMKCCAEAILMVEVMAEKGSVMAVSDAAAGAALCAGAIKAASLNVYINTKTMQDRALAEAFNETADDLLMQYVPYAARVFDAVLDKLNPKAGM